MDLMDSIGVLDESLRVAIGEVEGVCLDCNNLTEKLKAIERVVRETTVYDPSRFSSL